MDLLGFVILYLLISVLIGIFTSTWVRTSKDFAVAGRHLPLPVVTATVFATWFGAEAIFGSSATFVKEGIGGILADPFGASMCLIIAGIFFSSQLYKLNVLTLGDYFRSRYGRAVEVLTTICIILAYLGWVSAQIKALGLVISLLSQGYVSQELGMFIGAFVVLTYTTMGGMFSVAVLDFVQMAVIIIGLLYIAYLVSGMTGGVGVVIQHASDAGKLRFFPEGAGLREWFIFIAPGITMMLGSIPQQDVFQRITSAKSAKTALNGSLIGGLFYLCFCFVPIFIAYSATLIDPELFNGMLQTTEGAEHIIPTLVLNHMPFLAQVLFFGAVISAIMSTSSATLLAPSVTFAENIVRNFFPHLTDKGLLRIMRICTVCFTGIVLSFSLNTDSSIYEMVENAYSVTLVGAFVPLIIGPFWKRASNQGALFAIFSGIISWLLAEHFQSGEETLFPPQLIGLFVSMIGMVAGSLLPQWISGSHRSAETRES